MTYFDEEANRWLVPISYVISAPKYWSFRMDSYMSHKELQGSRTLGWKCELCGAKSRPAKNGRVYKHTLIKRVKWHINGRCPAEEEKKQMELTLLYE